MNLRDIYYTVCETLAQDKPSVPDETSASTFFSIRQSL